jgi:5-formyltetrahydrofolate cyclo-ligase
LKENDKKSLRKHWKAIPPPADAFSLSQKILDWLIADPDIQKAKHIGLYSPFTWEPNLLGLWNKFPSKVAFPKIENPNDGVFFHLIGSLADLRPGYSGIPEPPAHAPKVTWENGDILLIPGISFDREGIRLGSGKGYYDRFLATQTVPLKAWGVTFQSRISSTKLPREAHDVPMQSLVTESGLVSMLHPGANSAS